MMDFQPVAHQSISNLIPDPLDSVESNESIKRVAVIQNEDGTTSYTPYFSTISSVAINGFTSQSLTVPAVIQISPAKFSSFYHDCLSHFGGTPVVDPIHAINDQVCSATD